MSDVENNVLEVNKVKSGADDSEHEGLSLGSLLSQGDRNAQSLGNVMSQAERSTQSLGSLLSQGDRSTQSLGSLLSQGDRNALANVFGRSTGASLAETLAGKLPSLKIDDTNKELDPKILDIKKSMDPKDEAAYEASMAVLYREHRQQVLRIQADIEHSMKNSLRSLSPDLQKEYARLTGNKLGGYSNEQLAFIKKNLGTKAYDDARTFNENGETLRYLDAKLRRKDDTPQSKEEWKERASLAYEEVRKSVLQLPEKLQDAFNQLYDTKEGKYSADQMAFLKKFCGRETYEAADRYNTAIEAMRGFKQIPRLPVDAPRGGEASLPGTNRDANSSQGGRGETVADRIRELSEKPKPENVPEKRHEVLQQLTQMQLTMVLKEVSRLPKELQKEFQALPLFKNGVSYNDAHVNFLRQHTNNVIADNMSNYIANRHYLLMHRKH